jgi:hypothetical protein
MLLISPLLSFLNLRKSATRSPASCTTQHEQVADLDNSSYHERRELSIWGLPAGRLEADMGRPGAKEDGGQRSGMNDHGSGKTVGEWWMSG